MINEKYAICNRWWSFLRENSSDRKIIATKNEKPDI